MVRSIIKWVNKTEFIKNSVTLITGTILAQIIPIALQPILRRIFDPSDFGLFAIYSTLLGIIVAIATLKYESTVMLPRKDEDAANLVVGSVLTALLMSLIICLVFFLFGSHIINYFDLPSEMSDWLLILPISIFIFSAYQVMNYWLIRKKAYKVSSFNKVVRRGAEGGVQWGAGMFIPKSGLIIGNIVGDLVNFLTGIIQLKRTGFNLKWIKKVKIIALMKRYKDFPLYSTLPAFLNTLSVSVPVLLINKFYGEEVTGYFDLSRMVLALPLALVSVSISQVLFQNLSERIREQMTIRPLILKTAKMLGLVAIVMVIAGYFFSVPVFKFVFGERWETSGVMTQILIAAYALKFIVSPLSVTFNALEKIFLSSLWQVIYFLGIASLFFFEWMDVETFLITYLIIDLIAYAIYFTLLIGQMNKYEKSLEKK